MSTTNYTKYDEEKKISFKTIYTWWRHKTHFGQHLPRAAVCLPGVNNNNNNNSDCDAAVHLSLCQHLTHPVPFLSCDIYLLQRDNEAALSPLLYSLPPQASHSLLTCPTSLLCPTLPRIS